MAIEGLEADYKAAVWHALEELGRAYPEVNLVARPDGEGGAFVVLDPVQLGGPYEQETTWIGFRIVFQYPAADVYPHYVRVDLRRRDGGALGEGMSGPMKWDERQAVQISRRSNHLDPTVQTAVLKLEKVLAWLRSRP